MRGKCQGEKRGMRQRGNEATSNKATSKEAMRLKGDRGIGRSGDRGIKESDAT
jgi:hypothetical protein